MSQLISNRLRRELATLEDGQGVDLVAGAAKSADLASSAAGKGGELVKFTQAGDGAVERTVTNKLREWVSVKDFGAVGDGVTDDTTAIQYAIINASGGVVFFPKGIYLVSNLNAFDAAGAKLLGESRYNCIIKAKPGTVGSLLRNSNAAAGTSAYCSVDSLCIDLNGQNVVGIDFSSVNNSTAQNFFIKGGESLGAATGTGVKFGAPLNAGAYSNSLINPVIHYCNKGVEWGEDANQNIVFGGEVISCTVGLDTAPGGIKVDTPKVFGTRVEHCGTGLKEGAIYGFYSGVRFEDNTVDIAFQDGSDHPHFTGGYTATSPTVISGLHNATAPVIHSSDLGWYEIESDPSRPKQLQGKHVFTAPGAALPYAPNGSYASYYADEIWLKNGLWVKAVNAAGNGQVFAMQIDGNDELTLRSLNSAGWAENPVNIGSGGSVRPLTNGTTQLGTSGRRWSEVFAATGTINTSDARDKTVRGELNDTEKRVAQKIKGLFKVFQWNDAIAKKGCSGARLHVGWMAQEVIAAFESEGLDPWQYAICCRDIRTRPVQKISENGGSYVVDEPVMDGDGAPVYQLSIRYEQLLAFTISAM